MKDPSKSKVFKMGFFVIFHFINVTFPISTGIELIYDRSSLLFGRYCGKDNNGGQQKIFHSPVQKSEHKLKEVVQEPRKSKIFKMEAFVGFT